jgi:hypothetical protein
MWHHRQGCDLNAADQVSEGCVSYYMGEMYITIYYYVLLYIIMYYCMILCIIIYCYTLLCIIVCYYILLCITICYYIVTYLPALTPLLRKCAVHSTAAILSFLPFICVMPTRNLIHCCVLCVQIVVCYVCGGYTPEERKEERRGPTPSVPFLPPSVPFLPFLFHIPLK